jgi:hypothetical protein
MDRQKSRHHFPAQQQVVDAAYSYTQIHSQFMPLQPYYHSYQEFASPSLSAANVPIARTREDRPIGTVNEDTEPTTGNVESVTDVPLPDLVRKRPEYLQRYGNWAKWDALFDSHPFIQGLGIDQSPEEVEIAFRKLRGDLRDGDLQRQLTVALKKNLRDKKGASPSYIDIVASEWGRFLKAYRAQENNKRYRNPKTEEEREKTSHEKARRKIYHKEYDRKRRQMQKGGENARKQAEVGRVVQALLASGLDLSSGDAAEVEMSLRPALSEIPDTSIVNDVIDRLFTETRGPKFSEMIRSLRCLHKRREGDRARKAIYRESIPIASDPIGHQFDQSPYAGHHPGFASASSAASEMSEKGSLHFPTNNSGDNYDSWTGYYRE